MGDKVGIITLGGRFNYGNRLQNYATEYIWKTLGYEPTSLYLGVRPNAIRAMKKVFRVIMRKTEPNPEAGMRKHRLAAFDRFDRNMNNRFLKSIDPECIREFRFFSVGSDQTWNPSQFAYNEDWFFLDFAKPQQRIALAPSIGLDSLTPKQARAVSRGVSNFARVSIRENRGAELIKKYVGVDAAVICDPTLVLPAESWRAVADEHCTPNGPYVFTYLLGGEGSEASDVLNQVTDRGRIPVVPLSDRQKPNEPDAGPAEFIDLIDHASHVVTDSFHAAVFSTILHTPLTIVHREGGASMFSRLEQLSQMLGIEEKVYGSPSFDLSLASDYEGVPETIEYEREKFMNYLEGCLDEQLPDWREGARG